MFLYFLFFIILCHYNILYKNYDKYFCNFLYKNVFTLLKNFLKNLNVFIIHVFIGMISIEFQKYIYKYLFNIQIISDKR